MSNLVINLIGEIQSSNFHDWKNELIDQIQSTNLELTSDIDFSSAELNVKTFKLAEKTLKIAKEKALNQSKDIQALFNAIDEVTEQARQTRLILERQIKIRKIEVKEEFAFEGVATMQHYIEEQSDDFKTSDISRFIDKSIFLSKIKGTRGILGAKHAVNQLCDQFKNEIIHKLAVIQSNVRTLDSIALENLSLFQDKSFLINLLPNDLDIIIDERINNYHANQQIINQTHTNDSESSDTESNEINKSTKEFNFEPLGMLETKIIISDLLMKTDEDDIIKALLTCLRLIEDEKNRINDLH
mgnify:CR=1 FL=1